MPRFTAVRSLCVLASYTASPTSTPEGAARQAVEATLRHDVNTLSEVVGPMARSQAMDRMHLQAQQSARLVDESADVKVSQLASKRWIGKAITPRFACREVWPIRPSEPRSIFL